VDQARRCSSCYEHHDELQSGVWHGSELALMLQY
jgi:hypothetical protein